MPLPTREQILSKATKIFLERQHRGGIEPITPEAEELKEGGQYEEARTQLMGPEVALQSQQRQYINDMANEVGMKVMPEEEFREHNRLLRALRWDRRRLKGFKPPTLPCQPMRVDLGKPLDIGAAIRGQGLPSVDLQIKPSVQVKPKRKRQRLHVQRNGKKSRKWNRRKSYSFSDDVWKVRKL